MAVEDSDIGKLVAEKLDIPYYDQEITEIAAKKSGLNNEVLRENDEIATTSIFGNFMAGSYTGCTPVPF